MSIFSSNIINIVITCLFSCSLIFVPRHILIKLFQVLIILISILIIYSYIFNIGDVVYIFKYYKRAFFLFSDDINIALLFLYYAFLLHKNIIYPQLALIAFFMAFGKMAFILFIICLIFIFIRNKNKRKKILTRFSTTFFIAIFFTLASGKLTFFLYDKENGLALQQNSVVGGSLKYKRSINAIQKALEKNDRENAKTIIASLHPSDIADILESIPGEERKKLWSLIDTETEGAVKDHMPGGYQDTVGRAMYSVPAYENCRLCFITEPLKTRVLSIIAGTWMTSQGGYSGKLAISTPEEFANLIYNSNPYSINDSFNVTYDDWLAIGGIHNAYLGTGSSYGPLALGALIIFIFFIIIIGWRHKSDSYFYNMCFSYFLVVTIFNQSQQYIQAYNFELIVLSFCGAYVFNKVYGLYPDKHKNDNYGFS